MNDEPNLFELRADDGTQLTYSTSSISGEPQLSYGEHAFSGADIGSEQTQLGTEVTVTLRSVPDAEHVTLTLLVPPVRLEHGPAELETVAVVTTRLTSIAGPPPGQGYRYELVPLRGEASFVTF